MVAFSGGKSEGLGWKQRKVILVDVPSAQRRFYLARQLRLVVDPGSRQCLKQPVPLARNGRSSFKTNRQHGAPAAG